jgi:hypothetical protein
MDFRITTRGNSRYRESRTFVPLASDISSGKLNTSPELGTYTSALFTSSSTRVLVSRRDVTVTSPAVLCGTSSKWILGDNSHYQYQSILDFFTFPLYHI